ncbi:glycosyl transferase [Arenicella chitinivorans]|uniref:Glycosyl transferase n=1 Tax=Arenicella chitinivorans TaxID=1329800 RepID=A0A918RLK4_9GAMM|nr:glycosyltransferase family 2 protein [Arenicella chitinivorans]GGZ99774.1 glycosyl transferase [Arenicella chitinivorans]
MDTNSQHTHAAHSPVVTVVMPVYNVRDYIRTAVESVLAQTYDDLELIVVDDESPDDSIACIQNLIDADPRIQLVHQENRGLAGARNTGIRQARGEFIAFLDSDDYWHPDKLRHHVTFMQAHPEVGVSFSASMFVNEQGQSLEKMQTPAIKSGYTPRDVFCRNPIGNGSAPVIRNGVLQQLAFRGKDKHGRQTEYWQYFNESLKQSEDIDCWTRLALLTATEFSLIDKPLTYYRLNNAGLSADVASQYQTWLKFIDGLAELAPEFVKRHTPAAKAFQCRYIARRCISQAQGRQALSWFVKALRYSPGALMTESKRTLVTAAASLVMACLPEAGQRKLVARFL